MESYIVKKLTAGTVFYKVPGENKERTWKGDNARLRIPFQELEDCMFDGAIRRLFAEGNLYIEDKECRIKLGLEAEDPTLENDIPLVLDASELEKILYTDSVPTFKKKMEKLGGGSLEVLFSIAINSKKQLPVAKSDYLRKKYFIDVDMIQRQKREDTVEKEV